MRKKQWTEPAVWKKLRPVTRSMRRESTSAEDMLWQAIRGRKLNGLRFRRQHPIGVYVVDFFCVESQLAIEADGGVHEASKDEDRFRTQELKSRGVEVLRFRNEEIVNDLDRVLLEIKKAAVGGRTRAAENNSP